MNIVNKIRIRLILTCLGLCLLSVYSKSQVLFNNGSNIHAKTGVLVFVDGTVVNQDGQIEVEEAIGISAELIIQQNFVNNAIAGGNGYYRVLGDWENNNTFNSGSGSVFLEGNNQLLTGTMSTYFFNLILDGTGIKSQTIDQFVLESLNLNHLELATETHSMFIENSNVNAVQRTDGFVSSLDSGFLSRTTNTSNMYLFPVGSSIGTDRYRPVEIIPNNTNGNTFTVRMANVDATAEGFDRNLVEDDICETNPLFYHRINRTNGNASIDLSIFFNEVADGNWDGIANWTVSPNQWEIVEGSSSTTSAPLSYAHVNTWNTFNQTPYILYNINPEPEITPEGPFCENDSPIDLSANIPGGTWSGSGIIDATDGTFDPETAGAGNHIITYEVNVGGCIGTDMITIEVIETPDATITNPGDFCDTDDPVNLVAATAGGIWSGDGITDANTGTFDPAVVGEGNHEITYTITENGCTDSDQITIGVFGTPDASITHPGIFCSDDDAVTLNSATLGGTWSGNGITDASAGTFDPAVAGAGDHVITYNVGTGVCSDTDNITITVNQTPDVTCPDDFVITEDDIINLTGANPVGGLYSGTGVSEGQFDPSSLANGDYIITYSYTDVGTGCSNSCTFIISVDIPEPIEMNCPEDIPNVCETDDPFALLGATPIDGVYSGTGVTDGTFYPTEADYGQNLITYSFSGETCTFNIFVTEDGLGTINTVGPFCLTDNSVNLSTTTGVTNVVWSGNGIIDPSSGTFSPSDAGIGVHEITVCFEVFIPEYACPNCTSTTITVLDSPDATIDPVDQLCTNDPEITLSAATAGGVWSGTGITDANTGTFDPQIAGEGIHTITYSVSIGDCDDSNNITITVNQTPEVSITHPGSFCDTDATVNLIGTPAGGTWIGTGITDENNGIFDPIAAGEGNHTITYQLTTNGCTGSEQIIIEVFGTPDATINDPGSFCDGDAVTTLTAATPGGIWSGNGITDSNAGIFNPSVAGLGNHVITYNIGVGDCSDTDNITISVFETPQVSITNPGDFCDIDDAVNLESIPSGGIWSGNGITDEINGIFDPSVANIGNNTITYQYGAGNCIGSEQITIQVLQSADASIEPAGPFCYTDTIINLNAASEGGIWSGPGVSVNGIFNMTQAGVGNHLITHVISGVCGDSASINIKIFPSDIQADYVIENPVCLGGDDGYIEFAVSGGTPPYTFSWDENGYSETNYISGITEGEYTITIIDSNGCFMEVDGIIITDGSDDCIFIPNAFTPNGDGINDQWIIDNIDQFPDHQIQVFNRWGQEVYSGRIGEAPWDGTMNNKPLPTGSYIYVVQLSMTSKDFVGIVTLIR